MAEMIPPLPQPTEESDPVINKISFLALASILLVGCAINQTVKPVEPFVGTQVCIIVNPAVSQAGFLVTYVRILTEKGFTVRQLPLGSAVTECPVTSTYTANWRWDLGLYMAFADIKVFSNGQQSGQAVYDSTAGGANMNKFIKGETKITELVNQLFPNRATAAPTPTAAPALAPSATPSLTPAVARDEAMQLQKLKELRDKGLITQEEYERKRKEILDRL
jgi:hypothetical protein